MFVDIFLKFSYTHQNILMTQTKSCFPWICFTQTWIFTPDSSNSNSNFSNQFSHAFQVEELGNPPY